MDREFVSSSNLVSVGWENQTLEIEFKSGAVYVYHGVPEELYQELMASPSKGSFFAANIKKTYQGIKQ